MTYLLVPGDAGADWASVWVGAVNEPDADAAEFDVVAGSLVSVPVREWNDPIAHGRHRLVHRWVTVEGLPERSRVPVSLERNGRIIARAMLGTLPARLPGAEERPFTIFLGSCFARGRDGEGKVGGAYALLPDPPDLKILCGDQVYLDAPSRWTIFPPRDDEDLRGRLLQTYVTAWTQDPGFVTLLRDGPNLFLADDHDFWNNAPNPSITAPITYNGKRRAAWKAGATDLYRAFQRPADRGVGIYEMDGLSICVADMRVDREPGTTRFMTDADLDKVCAWAENLRAPGCLVVGQLIFSGTAGWKGRFTDWTLPDYDQYARLAAALVRAPRSVVVLTGDVHFGRVAVARLDGGRAIFEVVASPLTLVGPVPPNTWKPAPTSFPAEAIPGQVQRRVRTEEYSMTSDHFATVELTRSGGGIEIDVKGWPVDRGGRPPRWTQRWKDKVVV